MRAALNGCCMTDLPMLTAVFIWEQYMTFGDTDFLAYTYPLAESLMEFVSTRKNAEGFIQGIDDDWTFVDWSEIDKTGAVCAEQMLFVKALLTMAQMAESLHKNTDDIAFYREEAAAFLQRINAYYWNDEKGAFIDSYASGKNHVTRHANIFALLFGLATDAQKESIVRNVILNENITKITTPFFEGFELDIMAMLGRKDYLESMFRNYWGAMLDMGATSYWEGFDVGWTNNCFRIDELPVAGREDVHGDRGEFCYPGFRNSLCHGWGAGPAAWCINRVLGIRPLDVGCRTVEVKPALGDLAWAEGAMALPDGKAVRVRAERRADGSLDVKVDAPDGVKVKR